MKERQRGNMGHNADVGDSWTFIAVERTTKLVLAYVIGDRSQYTTKSFLHRRLCKDYSSHGIIGAVSTRL